jgi:hypothetical protein
MVVVAKRVISVPTGNRTLDTHPKATVPSYPDE